MRQVLDSLAAIPTGSALVHSDPWTGWPSTTLEADGGRSARRRILVPYNGTRIADGALQVAAEWCELLAAEAWVLYVRPWDPVRGGRIFIETPTDALAVAHAGVAKLRGLGAAASTIVRDASRRGIADTIVAEAETLDATSIVIGSPARRPLMVVLLSGSTSLAVARQSRRPVILVKAPKQARRTSPSHTRPVLPTTSQEVQPGDQRR